MTGYERKVWLSQIDRIHREAKKARETEMREQAQYLADLRNQEEE